MEFVRQIIDSSLLDKISLPESLKNKKVEIIVLPLSNSNEELVEESIENFMGILSNYKDPNMIPFEKKAWEKAMEEKHGNI